MENLDEDKLSDKAPIFKVAFRMLKHAMKDILLGNCDEEEVTDMLARLNPDKNGYYRDDDFWNTEESMSYLKFGKNRVKFYNTLKDFGVKSMKISNMNVGYLKKDIKMINRKLLEEAEDVTRTKKKKRYNDSGEI